MKGGFDNALDSATGRHGDLFDGSKLSIHALIEGTEEAKADAVQVGSRVASISGRGSSAPSPARLTMTPPPDDGNMEITLNS